MGGWVGGWVDGWVRGRVAEWVGWGKQRLHAPTRPRSVPTPTQPLYRRPSPPALPAPRSGGVERSVLLWQPKGNTRRAVGELPGHAAGVCAVAVAEAQSQAGGGEGGGGMHASTVAPPSSTPNLSPLPLLFFLPPMRRC